MRCSCLFSFMFVSLISVLGQKPIIDSSVFGKWPSLAGKNISNNGNYVLYALRNVPVKCWTLVIQSTSGKWEKEIPGIAEGVFSGDSRQAIFKRGEDSLCLLTLGTEKMTYIPYVSSYKLSNERTGEWLAYTLRGQGRELVFRHLETGKELHFTSVKNYLFSPTGSVVLLEKSENIGITSVETLYLLNLQDGKETKIWSANEYDGRPGGYVIDLSATQLAFFVDEKFEGHTVPTLWYYRIGMDSAIRKSGLDHSATGGMIINSGNNPQFSKDGRRIFFELQNQNQESGLPVRSGIQVDVWHYSDRELQSHQLLNLSARTYMAMIDSGDRHSREIRLQLEEEVVYSTISELIGDFILIKSSKEEKFWWDHAGGPSLYLVSLIDGSRILLKKHLVYNEWFAISPKGNYVIHYNSKTGNYFSYSIVTGHTINITQSIPTRLSNEDYYDVPNIPPSVGIATWLAQDESLLIYDNYDIWRVDPSGNRPPENITHGYGRREHIKFRLIKDESEDKETLVNGRPAFLLSAFNKINKYNGFYRKMVGVKGDPELLTMGPYNYFHMSSQSPPYTASPSAPPIKAKDTNVWIVTRMNYKEAPNYYLTHDFISFIRLSKLCPEKYYNWLTAELMSWKMPDGKVSQGILFKPENFDPAKKYPVILNYYEKVSDRLYDYLEPASVNNNINIPYFVSRGYLVFLPDIEYKIGATGESVVNSVGSAAQYLAKKPWVNASKMAVQGHSFGAFETNYLVTRSHLFAAAVSCSGGSDWVSGYDELIGATGNNMQSAYENDQLRIGASLWDRPDLYIKNSPIFRASRITTPLLMVNNKEDRAFSSWSQGVEFFSALRRLRKKVWMLQYDGEGHSLSGRNADDFTIRLTQFLDYYLRGARPPKWMTQGIPAKLKGIDAGFELETGRTKP